MRTIKNRLNWMVKNCLMEHTWLLLLLHCMRMEVDSFKSVVADAGAGV